ncbi:MAG: peptidase M61, partial [Gammaproteobacteria bacterium]|nr:peptidase M61 [Gammaproteobacteria bacterium]
MKHLRLPLLGLGLAALSLGALAAKPNANAVSYTSRENPEILVLDARDAGRGLMTSTMTIPVKPGAFTFVYPKWIPGEHGPTGPLNDISQLKVSA